MIEHSSGFSLGEALDDESIRACRELFREYEKSLGISLCFQGFEQELATLPGAYARPRGRLFLARVAGMPAGCGALRPLSNDEAEMKRLYVRPDFRGMGLGRMLAECIVDDARSMGYRKVKLDTLPAMAEAQSLYESLGFAPCEKYNDNPVDGVRFLALELAAR